MIFGISNLKPETDIVEEWPWSSPGDRILEMRDICDRYHIKYLKLWIIKRAS